MCVMSNLLCLPLVSHRYRHEKQHLELSNIQVLHSFCFPANELQTRSQYIWLVDNAHALYSNMAARILTMPIIMPTARGL